MLLTIFGPLWDKHQLTPSFPLRQEPRRRRSLSRSGFGRSLLLSAGGTVATARAAIAATALTVVVLLRLLLFELTLGHVALVDPDLHADAAEVVLASKKP